jgi:peptide/nickel transport system substrate-binding protein
VETDQAARNKMIKEAFTILRNDYGYLPLHQQPMSWGVRKGIKVAQRADDVLDIRNVVMP